MTTDHAPDALHADAEPFDHVATHEAAEREEIEGVDRPGLHADAGATPHNESFGEVLARNIQRRSFLLGAAAAVPVLMTTSLVGSSNAEAASNKTTLSFTPISPSTLDQVVVPQNYRSEVVIRWGDPLFEQAPAFVADGQSAEAQRKQFGYNNDFVGYFPLWYGKNALLVVNHEYTTGSDMFRTYQPGVNKAQADIEIAAHGGSVVEITPTSTGWRYVKSTKFNRRITGDTPMQITGPAAGHALMKTSADPTGATVLGMLNNCSGGKTPWGTWLTCEENFNQYFANNGATADPAIKAVHTRYGLSTGATSRRWEAFYDRFDVVKEPNEAFRFGWVIEIDPYDPTFTPRKRTALGRAKHEAATVALAKNNRAVVYTGDDQQFDYVYKFVSKGRLTKDRGKNLTLLDEGVLYVAKLNDDNTGVWLPLTIDNPTLRAKFADQGEILIKTRLAADAVGATAMDRPEDCQPNPVNGKVYLTMTNNSARSTLVADAGSAKANPRIPNLNGHIIELTEGDGGDHASTTFTWEIFLLCGNPNVDLKTSKDQLTPGLASSATFFAGYADATKLGKIASPDNIAFDDKGNLWIATDGQPSSVDIGRPNDAMHAVPTAGPERGYLRQFLSGPKGCEVCGPEFSDDNKTLFAAIQHPGEDGGVPNKTSTWPDGASVTRPAVIAVKHVSKKVIGS